MAISKEFRALNKKLNEATAALDTAYREASSCAGVTDRVQAYRDARLIKARERVNAAEAAIMAYPVEDI